MRKELENDFTIYNGPLGRVDVSNKLQLHRIACSFSDIVTEREGRLPRLDMSIYLKDRRLCQTPLKTIGFSGHSIDKQRSTRVYCNIYNTTPIVTPVIFAEKHMVTFTTRPTLNHYHSSRVEVKGVMQRGFVDEERRLYYKIMASYNSYRYNCLVAERVALLLCVRSKCLITCLPTRVLQDICAYL